MDLTRINDRTYLEGVRVGEIANEALRAIVASGVASGKITKADIVKLKTERGRNHSVFMLSQPVLLTSRTAPDGRDRAWGQPIDCYGELLYLNSQWQIRDKEVKENLIDWIIDWVNKNGLPISLPLESCLIEKIVLPRVIKGPEQEPILSLPRGKDRETVRISYDNVPEESQVPQLCSKLEGVYECILAFARETFGDWVDSLQPRRIPVILKQNCPSRIYVHNDEYVMKKINEMVASGMVVDLSTTRRILRHTMRICGIFVDEPYPHIEIYFNQFSASCWDEYLAKVGNVLAHEYLHYLEYEHCRRNGHESYADDRVSEALADFFGALYSIDRATKNDLAVALNKYNLWRALDGSGWPYAYALYFYCVKGKEMPFSSNYADYIRRGSINKLVDVFDATPIPEDAYDKLMKL